MRDGIGEVLIECFIHIIRIEVPQVMRRKLQLFGITLDLAEEEDVSVTLLDGPLSWIKEVLHRRVVLGQQLVMEVEN